MGAENGGIALEILMREMRVYDIADLRKDAKRRLPKAVFEFIERGTDRDIASRYNTAFFDRIRLTPRNLQCVTHRTTNSDILGQTYSMPLVIGPTGIAGLTWYRGDLALAKAAVKFGVPFVLATRSMSAMETLVTAAEGYVWLQLYAAEDIHYFHIIVDRALNSDIPVLILTVDTPIPPLRSFNRRNGFSTSLKFNSRIIWDFMKHPRWLAGVIGRYMATGGLPRFENLPGRPSITTGPSTLGMLDGGLTWNSVKRLRDLWPRKLLLKGILAQEDAQQAVDLGLDGIIVSNHGGRNFDAAPSPLEVLPEILGVVGRRIPIYIDGGISSGVDIARSLAMGANAVFAGRSLLYGVASYGEKGVSKALEILREELDSAMAMLGCSDVRDIRRRQVKIRDPKDFLFF